IVLEFDFSSITTSSHVSRVYFYSQGSQGVRQNFDIDVWYYNYGTSSWTKDTETFDQLTEETITQNYNNNNYISSGGICRIRYNGNETHGIGKDPGPQYLYLDHVYVQVWHDNAKPSSIDLRIQYGPSYGQDQAVVDSGINGGTITINDGDNWDSEGAKNFRVIANTSFTLDISHSFDVTEYTNASTRFHANYSDETDVRWEIMMHVPTAGVAPYSQYNQITFSVEYPQYWGGSPENVTNPSGGSSGYSISGPANNNYTIDISNYQAGWWSIFFDTSLNFINNVRINGSTSLDEFRIDDTLRISAAFIGTLDSGHANLTIFNATDDTLIYEQKNLACSGTSVTFSDWTIQNDLSKPGQLIIQISVFDGLRMGYQNKTITIYNSLVSLNITFHNFSGPTEPYVENPASIDTWCPENITLYVRFTDYRGTPLTNLEFLNVQLDSQSPVDIKNSYDVGSGLYSILINYTDLIQAYPDIQDLQHVVRVNASKQGVYYNDSRWFTWNIHNASTSLQSVNASINEKGGDFFSLLVTYNDTTHFPNYNISNAVFTASNITGSPSTIPILSQEYMGNGLYNMTFQINITYSTIFSLRIHASRLGFDNATLTLPTTISLHETDFTWDVKTLIIKCYEDFSLTVKYNYSRGSVPEPVTFSINWSIPISSLYNPVWENYTLTLYTGGRVNAGPNQVFTLYANKTNFEKKAIVDIQIDILENLTQSELVGKSNVTGMYNLELYINQSRAYTTFYNNSESVGGGVYGLDNASDTEVNVTLEDESLTLINSWKLSMTLGTPGRYDLILNTSLLNSSNGLIPGSYFINITYKKFNHEFSTVYINLTIIRWRAFIDVLNDPYTTYTQWKHLAISPIINCSAWIYGTGFEEMGINSTVDLTYDATVTVRITDLANTTLKSEEILTFSAGQWSLSQPLNLSTDLLEFLVPGDYYVWFHINAPYLVTHDFCYNLTILERANATFENLVVPKSIFSLETLSISGKVLVNLGSGFVEPPSWGFNWREVRVSYSIIYHHVNGRIAVESGEKEINRNGEFRITSKTLIGFDVQSITFTCWIEEQDYNWPNPSVNSYSSNEQQISVSISPVVITILAAVGIGSVMIVGAGIGIIVKRVKAKKVAVLEQKTQKIFDYFNDLISIRKLFLVQREKKIVLFEDHYNKEDFETAENESIVSLINTHGTDIPGYKAALDLTFHDGLKLIIDDGLTVRLAIVTNKIPSERFLRGLTRFLQYLEVNVLQEIKTSGTISNKAEVLELLDRIFDISIILPYRISYKALKKSLNHFQNQLLMDARDLSKEGYFFIGNLYEKINRESLMPREYIFQEISALIANGLFVPFSFDEVLKKGKKIKYYSFFEDVGKEKTVEQLQEEEVVLEEDELGYLTPVTAVEEPDEIYSEDYGLIEEEEIIEEIEEEITPFEKIIEEEGIGEEKEVTTSEAPQQTMEIEEIETDVTAEEIEGIFEEMETVPPPVIPEEAHPSEVVETIKEEIVHEAVSPPKIPKEEVPGIEQISFETLRSFPGYLIATIDNAKNINKEILDLENFIRDSMELFNDSKEELKKTILKVQQQIKQPKKSLEDDIQDLQYDITLASGTMASAFENLIRMEKKLNSIKSALKKFSKNVQKTEKEFKREKSQDTLQKQVLALLQAEKSIQVEKLQEIEKKIKNHEIFLTNMGNEVENAEKELKIVKNKILETRKRIDSFTQEVDKDKMTMMNLQEKCHRNLEKIRNFEEESKKLEQLLQDHENMLEKMMQENLEANTRLNEIKLHQEKQAEIKPPKPKKKISKQEKIPSKLDEIMATAKKVIPEDDSAHEEVTEIFEGMEELGEYNRIVKEVVDEERISSKLPDTSSDVKKKPNYELQLHCPNCKKIIEERELKLLAKGFSPQCPACGFTLDPSLINDS
ncbi:MAG: hypothetical protein ACTSRB_00580, partial [Candidatus Helarchaeota archaeon]